MRQRVEDLGRLMVHLEKIITEYPRGEFGLMSVEKEFDYIIKELKESEHADTTRLWRMLSRMSCMLDELYECLEIAKGEDYLNERSE